MESVEVSAKNVDEAIDIALQELGLKRNEVEIEILTAGKSGLFGLGGEQARVRVTAKPGAEQWTLAAETIEEEDDGGRDLQIAGVESEGVQAAAEYLRRLLQLAGVEADVSVRRPETPGDGLGRASAVLDIEGEDLGLLIGRRGTTLAAVQYLVNLAMNRRSPAQSLVAVDVEHYHRRREESLRGLAQRMADRVRQSGRSMTLEPMPAAERRIVHMTLAEYPGVATRSVGEGETRKVVIQPARGRTQR